MFIFFSNLSVIIGAHSLNLLEENIVFMVTLHIFYDNI